MTPGTNHHPDEETKISIRSKNAGRWRILRDAILATDPPTSSSSKSSSPANADSIHRFEGYNLLHSTPISSRIHKSSTDDESMYINTKVMDGLLTKYDWDHSISIDENVGQLEIAALALGAWYPKGKVLRVIFTTSKDSATANTTEEETEESDQRDWFVLLKDRLVESNSVCVVKVDEKKATTSSTTDGSCSTKILTVTTSILVQEISKRSCTKFFVKRYDLHPSSSVTLDTATKSSFSTTSTSTPPLSLLTREPKDKRLSLLDLVSHRVNQGVDNTGNICVWDSERTLAYLLFHHWNDFIDDNRDCVTNIKVMANNGSILELGTGMAGLSAVALGLRWASQSLDSNTANLSTKINITLTDGNPAGVKNNKINQNLTSSLAQSQTLSRDQQDDNPRHPYEALDVSCRKLLWTTEIKSGREDDPDETASTSSYDIVLVSDCTHFQNFHSALAVTTLRSMVVGGRAIFCQPSRGRSLDNFCDMILDLERQNDPLVSTRWFSQDHPILKAKDEESKRKYNGTDIYTESLHRPKIWIVTKLREMTVDDRDRLVELQTARGECKA